MKINKTLVLIMGNNASGKTTLAKQLVKNGYKNIVSATTRKPRKGEVDGVDYHFLSEKEFFSSDLIEKNKFGDNWYGTMSSEVNLDGEDEVLVSVVEPNGVRQILEYFKDTDNVNIYVVYLDIPEKERREALLKEGINPDEVEKRLARGDIKSDLDLYQIKPDLIIKKFKNFTHWQVLEFIECAKRL